jgi:hypothetical protein
MRDPRRAPFRMIVSLNESARHEYINESAQGHDVRRGRVTGWQAGKDTKQRAKIRCREQRVPTIDYLQHSTLKCIQRCVVDLLARCKMQRISLVRSIGWRAGYIPPAVALGRGDLVSFDRPIPLMTTNFSNLNRRFWSARRTEIRKWKISSAHGGRYHYFGVRAGSLAAAWSRLRLG